MSFIARELVLKLSPQPLQMQRVCNICDTTGGIPVPECPAPSGMFLGNDSEAGRLTALRLQLQAKLSQN